MSTVAPPSKGHDRLGGIDIARAAALIGMLAVHFGPKDAPGLLGDLYAAPHGRASILFAVVAGVGMSLLGRHHDAIPAARLRLFSFALVLLPLGLALDALDHSVAVILHHYAAFFLLGALALTLRSRTLLAIGGLVTLLGPVSYFALRTEWPTLFDRQSVSVLSAPGDIASALLFSGPYPLLTWAGPILWGMWLGRQRLDRIPVSGVLVGAGLAVAVSALLVSDAATALFGQPDAAADWRHLAASAAHSQIPLWLFQAMGVATAVIGICLVLARFTGKALSPLATVGRSVLSLYVLHLLLLTAFPAVFQHDTVPEALLSVAGYALVAGSLALLWQHRFKRGPVEQILHTTATRIAAAAVHIISCRELAEWQGGRGSAARDRRRAEIRP